MHRLDRTGVSAPACLGKYRHGRDRWGDIKPEHKEEIKLHLEHVQGRLCAYCEGSLEELGAHIEHFRCRDKHPQYTFDWYNLLWCCDRCDSCGHYKDSGACQYAAKDLIDPTSEDPDRFFRFHKDGTITIRREGLSESELRRAEATIRALNLDAKFGRLRRMRERAAKAYLAQDPSILMALLELPQADRQAYVREELERTARDPFCTVIRHLFEELV